MNCIICGNPIDGWDHNPEPVRPYDEGRCCDFCNSTVVVPARISAVIQAQARHQVEES